MKGVKEDVVRRNKKNNVFAGFGELQAAYRAFGYQLPTRNTANFDEKWHQNQREQDGDSIEYGNFMEGKPRGVVQDGGVFGVCGRKRVEIRNGGIRKTRNHQCIFSLKRQKFCFCFSFEKTVFI